MMVGITYDLKDDYLSLGYSKEQAAEFDSPETIESIENVLQSLGFQTDRIGHVKNLAMRLVKGDRWDMVFNIAEGLYGFGRESQIPCLLDAYQIPYTFSSPVVLGLTLHKGMTKHVIRDLGLPTADFAVVETEDDVEKIDLPFPLFAKPIAEGTSKGISSASKIHCKNELVSTCRELLALFEQPVLIERYLSGREFTIGIVGTGNEAKVLGVMEIFLGEKAEGEAYSFFNKAKYEEVVKYQLADDFMAKEARNLALAVWRGLGCRDAGRVDLRADDFGCLHFIEVNPLAGLHPKHSDLPILCSLSGITYYELIKMIMQSAISNHKFPLLSSNIAKPIDKHIKKTNITTLRDSLPISKC